ncbi:MAG: AAA family ATPase [Myxococcota bacterium]
MSESFEIETFLSVSVLARGKHLVFPVADPTMASLGTLEHCYLEQRLALGEHLRRADTRVISRFALSPRCEEREIFVSIPRADLPSTLQPVTPLGLRCVAIPHGGAMWVVVLSLGLTVFVERGESVDDRVASEVRRYAAALELDGGGWLDLVPPTDHRIEAFTVEVQRGAVAADRHVALKRKFLAAKQDQAALDVLRTVADPMHGERVRTLPPVIGRDKEVEMLDALLGGAERHSVLLVGEELVGKSAVVSAWLQRIHTRDEARFVFGTSGAQLIAGMSGLGQWQERVRRVFEAAERLDAIVVFESFRDLSTDRSGGDLDLASAIKPYVEQRRVRVLGEITPEGADLSRHQNPGFVAGFSPVRVAAQDRDAGRRALRARVEHASRHGASRPQLTADAIETVVELTDRYLPYRPFPGKAVRFFEELRDTVEREYVREARMLSPRDVYDLFSVQSGIPTFLLREDRRMDASAIRADFSRRLVGQEEAVRRVVETLCVVKAGLQPVNKPLASFLFVGPTGVGKTELARNLARFLFGTERRLIRFDMSEFSGPDAASRLISGHGVGEGRLTLKVRQEPFAVVLLDEMEKAHPTVFDLLLQLLGEARLTDTRGRTAYFNNAIVVMTSNLGTHDRSARIGLVGDPGTDDRYDREIERFFRPEFINRIDRTIPFSELTRENILHVTGLLLEQITARRGFAELGISLDVSPKAQQGLADLGFTPELGARALRRVLEDQVVSPVARMLGTLGARARNAKVRVATISEDGSKDEVLLRLSGERFVFEVLAGAGKSARQDLAGYRQVSELRRRIHRWTRLPTYEEIEERLGHLLTEMTAGAGEASMETSAVAEHGAEHHRLNSRWERFANARREVESLEELALVAILSGESLHAVDAEISTLADLVSTSLLRLLVGLRSQPRVWLRAQECDAGTLNRWLLPLMEEQERHGFRLSPRLYRDRELEMGNFGPCLDGAALRERLLQRERKVATAVVEVVGEDAGSLLALEAGLHRWETAGNPEHLRVDVVSFAPTLTEDDWHKIQPGRPPAASELRAQPAVRIYDRSGESVRVVPAKSGLDVELPGGDYWASWERVAVAHVLLLEAAGGWTSPSALLGSREAS